MDNCYYLIERSDGTLGWKTKASLIVRHYLGTFETYTSLNPFKVSYSDFAQKVTNEFGKGYEMDYFNNGVESTKGSKADKIDMMGQWMTEFIHLVGEDMAWDLTQGMKEEAVLKTLNIKDRLRRGEVVEPAYEWVKPWTSLPKKVFNLPDILRVNNGN